MFALLRSCAACSVLLGSVAANAQVLFTDVSTERGIGAFQNEPGMAAGVASADYDNDGYADIFVPQVEGVPNALYHNLGDGSFEEIAASVGLDSMESARVALWFDYDGDGDLDLLVANDGAGAPTSFRLYRQINAGSFEDVTVAAGLMIPGLYTWELTGSVSGICAGDINHDGYLDFFIGGWSGPEKLFLNNAGNGFVDISDQSGMTMPTDPSVWQSVMMDFNGDGWLDIYVAVDFEENMLWINQKDNSFVNVAPGTVLSNAMNDMGMTMGDYDNDGDFDIYITNIYIESDEIPVKFNVLLRNNTLGSNINFTEVAIGLQVEHGDWGWGATFLDFDNDGFLDIAATNGWRLDVHQSRMFRNPDGGLSPFQDVSASVGFDDTHWGSALLATDFDRDGDLDLLQACVDGPLRLLDNAPADGAATGNYLVVRPRMPGRNTHAIGAVVRVIANGQHMMRLITAGTSFLGQEPAEAFFGLGSAQTVDQVIVEWPDGRSTTLNGVAVNQELDVVASFIVPAVSAWGAVAMVLLILSAGTVALRKSTAV